MSGEVIREKFIMLIDGGETHNFFDEIFVAKKRLKSWHLLVSMLPLEMKKLFLTTYL